MTSKAAPLRILIVDDEPPARDRARRLLRKIPDVEVVGEAATGKEALAMIDRLQPDVLLLDIQMPDLDGMRVVEALDDPPAIIFSTAYERYAVRAFEHETVDYLLKPYSAERLAKAIERSRRLLSGAHVSPSSGIENMKMPAQNGLATELVPLTQIVCFSITEGVVFLSRADGESLISEKTLTQLEDELPPSLFFRINRQSIINITFIKSYAPIREGGLRVSLQGGHTFIASRRRARHLKARLP